MRLRQTVPAALTAMLLAACASPTTAVAPPESTPEQWTYQADSPSGPENWGTLPGDEACSGPRQSPVDLVDPIPVQQRPPTVEYRTDTAEVLNNGHSVEFNPPAGGGIRSTAGITSTFDNLHFHAPSEHRIDGRQFPLELHFVNQSMKGATVIGLLVEEGAAARSWDSVVDAVERVPEETNMTSASIPFGDLLPTTFEAFEYKGSLTTPPCSPIVNWVVIRRPITMSADQIAAFTDIYSDTDRPVQPLAGRKIMLTRPN